MLSESLGESKQSTLRHKVNDASEGKTYKEKSTISKSKITNKK
jgi:hypothetical protein